MELFSGAEGWLYARLERGQRNELQRWLKTMLTLAVVMLAACDQSTQQPLSSTDSVVIGSPDFLSRAIDANLLAVQVRIDNVEYVLSPNSAGTQWSGTIQLPTNDTFSLEIEWTHDGVLLARYLRVHDNLGNGDVLLVPSEDYQTTGTEFDDNNNGISNLAELESGPAEVDVVIPRVSGSGPPGINGVFGAIWAEHTVLDTSGNSLKIDNLMLDQGADRPNGNTEFNWQALHDDSYLYLIVFAEDVSKETLNADSTDLRNDDTLHIYLDGDNSKGQTYDGVDDLHIIIPLLKLLRPVDQTNDVTLVLDNDGNIVRNEEGNLLVEHAGEQFYLPAHDFEPNSSRDADGRFTKGSNSVSLPMDMVFVNCRCLAGQHLYEIKINLAEANIQVDRPFGIEIQLDDDIDGGNREARYGWKHRSAAPGANTDNTWRNPSFMGTALLQN